MLCGQVHYYADTGKGRFQSFVLQYRKNGIVQNVLVGIIIFWSGHGDMWFQSKPEKTASHCNAAAIQISWLIWYSPVSIIHQSSFRSRCVHQIARSHTIINCSTGLLPVIHSPMMVFVPFQMKVGISRCSHWIVGCSLTMAVKSKHLPANIVLLASICPWPHMEVVCNDLLRLTNYLFWQHINTGPDLWVSLAHQTIRGIW